MSQSQVGWRGGAYFVIAHAHVVAHDVVLDVVLAFQQLSGRLAHQYSIAPGGTSRTGEGGSAKHRRATSIGRDSPRRHVVVGQVGILLVWIARREVDGKLGKELSYRLELAVKLTHPVLLEHRVVDVRELLLADCQLDAAFCVAEHLRVVRL